MIGSAESRTSFESRATGRPRVWRYVAVDGGSGALLLTGLRGIDPSLQLVDSPRHANLVVVVAPISTNLGPALAEIARALPRPAYALTVGPEQPALLDPSLFVAVDHILVGARHLPPELPGEIWSAMRSGTGNWPTMSVVASPAWKADTVKLPSRAQRALATELVVLALGPVQPFTAGPLRLVLVADGPQVLSAQVEAGYARRGVGDAMARSTWADAAELAARLDPLAPVAGRLAFTRAVEQLNGVEPRPSVSDAREACLALERARNHLAWTARTFRLLADARPGRWSAALFHDLTSVALRVPALATFDWIAPGATTIPPAGTSTERDALREIARECAGLESSVAGDRFLAPRTHGIGQLSEARLAAAGVTGPVFQASAHHSGDVRARLVVRIHDAAADIRRAVEGLPERGMSGAPGQWRGGQGEAVARVAGPRGRIGVRVVADGGPGPALVEWDRPSARLLEVVPEVVIGEQLADAEMIIASLDLAMAEADG